MPRAASFWGRAEGREVGEGRDQFQENAHAISDSSHRPPSPLLPHAHHTHTSVHAGAGWGSPNTPTPPHHPLTFTRAASGTSESESDDGGGRGAAGAGLGGAAAAARAASGTSSSEDDIGEESRFRKTVCGGTAVVFLPVCPPLGCACECTLLGRRVGEGDGAKDRCGGKRRANRSETTFGCVGFLS